MAAYPALNVSAVQADCTSNAIGTVPSQQVLTPQPSHNLRQPTHLIFRCCLPSRTASVLLVS